MKLRKFKVFYYQGIHTKNLIVTALDAIGAKIEFYKKIDWAMVKEVKELI
jgi:hypothetical protein